jgi:putative Holliday junction resolvase
MRNWTGLSEGYVLGFDFGLKHIGVAVAQTVTGHSSGLRTFRAKNGNPTDWPQLKALVAEYQPIAIIVGLPLNMDGSESDMALRAKKFANALAHRTRSEVIMGDERLSSWSADNTDRQTDSVDLHQESARRIIETWLRNLGRRQ